MEKQYNLAICPADARAKRENRPPEDPDTCTLCGSYCAVKIMNEWLDKRNLIFFDEV